MRRYLLKCYLKCFGRKGQALLVLIIFLAITLLLITSISFSAIKSSEIVRRNVNFQTSFDKAESLIEQAANNIDKGDTSDINSKDDLNRLTGQANISLKTDEFVDILKDQSINVDLNEQATTATGTTFANGIPTMSSMEIDCKPSETAIELTFVYNSGGLKTDKLIYYCKTSGTPALGNGATITGGATAKNLTSVSSDGTYYYASVPTASYPNLYLVRIKSYGNAKSTVKLKIQSGGNTYGTAKYLISASGIEADGSASSSIQVEKAAGYYLPPIFDYVFYQGG